MIPTCNNRYQSIIDDVFSRMLNVDMQPSNICPVLYRCATALTTTAFVAYSVERVQGLPPPSCPTVAPDSLVVANRAHPPRIILISASNTQCWQLTCHTLACKIETSRHHCLCSRFPSFEQKRGKHNRNSHMRNPTACQRYTCCATDVKRSFSVRTKYTSPDARSIVAEDAQQQSALRPD